MNWRKHNNGAVIVEFALSFPILLFTFIFICQIINLFAYDILGTYAAFAASRSYAVHRNVGWDEGAVDIKANQIAAATKAFGVATAIMSTYSLPLGVTSKQLKKFDPTDLQLDGFIAAASEIDASPSKAALFKAYDCLHQDFKIIEYGGAKDSPHTIISMAGSKGRVLFDVTETDIGSGGFHVPMKSGYGYPDTKPYINDSSDGFLQIIVGFFTDLLEQFMGLNKPEAGHPMMVSQVVFRYEYKTVLSRMGDAFLSFDGQKPHLFHIYQSCAMPIEPVPADFVNMFDVEPMSTSTVDAEIIHNQILAAERAVNLALDNLQVKIDEIMKLLKGRPDRKTWEGELQWNVSAANVTTLNNIKLINPEGRNNMSDHQLLNSYQNNTNYNPSLIDSINEWTDTSQGSQTGWLEDPWRSLNADIAYREDVIGWIDDEVNDLTSQISTQQGIIDDTNSTPTQVSAAVIERDRLKNEVKVWGSDGKTGRGGAENTIINQNKAIRGQLNDKLKAVEKALREYYELAHTKMKDQSGILGQYGDLIDAGQ